MATWNDTTSTTDGNYDAWTVWMTASTTSAGANTTWARWVGADSRTASSTVGYYWVNGTDWTPAAETEEARREREEREKKSRVEREEAQKRARELLESHLDEAQKKDLAERGEFEVESQSGKKYAIARGRAGNVYGLDERRRKIQKFCIHPRIDCPDEDTMFSQMCWLRWMETEFLKIANKTDLAA